MPTRCCPTTAAIKTKTFPSRNASARKALDLDPTLAHPHAVLGSNEMQYDWDFAGGEAEFKSLSNSILTMPRPTSGTPMTLA